MAKHYIPGQANAVLLVIVLHLLPSCLGHSTGAPESRCGTMVPGHWVTAQSTPSPFHIELSSDTLMEGDMLQVNLTSSKGQPGFKGFLIQVKRPGQIDEVANYGNFDPFKSDNFQSQGLNCFGNLNSAMTHKDPVEKNFVHLVWIAPMVEREEVYEVRVTFVENFWKIWPNQTPGKLIRVMKGKIERKEQNKTGNDSMVISPPLSPHPQPHPGLMPQLREVDTGFGGGPSQNGTGNGNGPNTYFNLQGSWDYFKTSWMNFMHYFGF